MVDLLIVLVLTVSSLACLYPIWYTIMLSFSDQAAANAGRVWLWPVGFNLGSYQIILEDAQFFKSFGISLERVLLGGAIQFILTVMMAYPLSKEKDQFPGKMYYVWFLIFCMLFSGGLIPTYLTVTNLGLQNSIWALVLPGAVPIFNVILLMNFFRNLPKELSEAAVVDGAGPWYVMLRMYVPLSLPALATVTLFSVVGHWNSFFDGLIYMSKPEYYPLQTYIQQLVVRTDPQFMQNLTSEELIQMMKVSNKTLNSAKLVVAMIPLILLYPFLQRFFIHGLVLGSVKE
jgi:ABC-type glycerol-3-phosphate transport system permease component